MTGSLPDGLDLTTIANAIKTAKGQYEAYCRDNKNHVAIWRSDFSSLWDYEQHLFDTYPEMLQSCGCFPNQSALLDVAVWKLSTNANFTLLLSNTDATVRCRSRDAFGALKDYESPDPALRILSDNPDGLNGIGPAAATALLTVYNPDRFTVMDKNVLSTLANYGVRDLPKKASVTDYERYLEICRRLVEVTHVTSLRQLDRCLWYLGSNIE